MPNPRKLLRILSILLVMALVLLQFPGCSGAEVAIGPEKASTGNSPIAQALLPKAEAGSKVKDAWSYDPTDKRDPFNLEPPARGSDDLYSDACWPWKQVWIDGVFISGSKEFAHIILADGSDYFVQVWDDFGCNHGRVTKIDSTGITFEERYLDPVDYHKIYIVEKHCEMGFYNILIPQSAK